MVRRMAELHVPGMSVAVVEHGRVRSIRAYGWADLEHCIRATDSTLFGIGSISKHFAAVGALRVPGDAFGAAAGADDLIDALTVAAAVDGLRVSGAPPLVVTCRPATLP